MSKIKGGYYIKARKIKDSDIAHAPPHVREIWDYLIRKANHSDKKAYGETLKRGQVLTSYDEIREDLHWMVGWRKQRYTKSQCEIAMKFLRKGVGKHARITTRKTTRGLVVTILNYSFYQNPKNYENYKESYNENYNENDNKSQPHDTIDKNGKNEKNDKKKDKPSPSDKKSEGSGGTKKKKSVPTVSPEVKEFCDTCYKFLKEKHGKSFPKTTNMEDWYRTVRLLQSEDGFTLQEIKETIRFAMQDPFWHKQVISLAGGIRKKDEDKLSKFQKIYNKKKAGWSNGSRYVKQDDLLDQDFERLKQKKGWEFE